MEQNTHNIIEIEHETLRNIIEIEHETLRNIIKILTQLEWSKTYSYCTGWKACPVCNGIKPGYGIINGIPPDNTDHKNDCTLQQTLQILNRWQKNSGS